MLPKPKRPFWIAAIFSSSFMLALAACDNAKTASTPDAGLSGSPPSSALSVRSTEPSASNVQSPEPSASASSVPSAAPSVEPPDSDPPASTEPGQKDAAPAYRMNKAYRIVPIDKEKSTDKVVLLTFDDGPKEAEMLGKILDTLDKHEAKAIFFVNGYRVKANPDLLKEIDARGQTIGNHSYDHIQLGKESADVIRKQIEGVQQIVQEVTGKTPVFFRPPFASSNDEVRKTAKENGLLFMTWSNGSLDWDLGKNVQDKPQAVIDNVLEQLHPGSNILMHELEWTADALDRLLTELENRGYTFVDPASIEIELE